MRHTRENITQSLERLYSELREVQSMSEDSVCMRFNVNCKKEYISILNEEIDFFEDELQEIEEYENRIRNHERASDAPFLCW